MSLLEYLCCPSTRTNLVYQYIEKDDEDKITGNNYLLSQAKKIAYPIRQNIPILIVDQAKEL